MSSRQNDVGGTEYAAAIAAQQPEKSPLSPVQEEAPMEKPNAFAEMVASMPDANTTPLPGLHHAIDAMYERVNAAQLAQEELDRQIPDDATLEFYLDVIAGEKRPPRCHHHPQSGCSCIAPYIARLRAALPALLEASAKLDDPNYQYAGSGPIHREAILCRNKDIDELRAAVARLTTENTKLTAQNAATQKRCDEGYAAHGSSFGALSDISYLTHLQGEVDDYQEVVKAVDRLTTERDKFRDWFQNAEQARAVAASKLKDAEDCDTDYRASLQQAEVEIARLSSEKAAVEEKLTEATSCNCLPGIQGTSCPVHCNEVALKIIARNEKLFREQAIQDIEALPTFGLWNGTIAQVVHGDHVERVAVLSILRGQ